MMDLRDLIEVSLGNLRRMKLRASLTISGIVIAIAAFVSMLSFGAGNQQHITKEFNELGLFNTLQVYPRNDNSPADSAGRAILDMNAIEMISKIPGVSLVYPYDDFKLQVSYEDSLIETSAQALPVTALNTLMFSRLRAGSVFSSDSSSEAMVTQEFLDDIGIKNPDSLIGQKIIVSVKVPSIDSALIHVIGEKNSQFRERFSDFALDSLNKPGYIKAVFERELNNALKRFMNGFVNSPEVLYDTITICGVIGQRRGPRLRIKPIIIPAATAEHLNAGGISTDPAGIIAALQSGALFGSRSNAGSKSFSHITVDLESGASYSSVSDSIKAMGYKTFSYAEHFKEIQKFFFYFDLALGVVGFIALVTAALGIVNTMVMSIIERTKQIGILKSLGADERDIRALFLAESAVIGSVGALIGILVGWLITRVASIVAKIYMEKEGIDAFEIFAMPLWLILTAFLVGLIVSLIAGYYPASRAARVDPVEALRNE